VADRLARLTNLVALLLNARAPMTLEDIGLELEPEAGYPDGEEARRQAFERDKKVLREEGIPIEVVPLEDGTGRVGYRIRPEEYYLPDLRLSDDERVALHLALAAVPLEAGWGTEAMWKLGDASGADAPPLASLPSAEALPQLFEGWRRRATVSFAYGGTARDVDPYGLLFRDGFWYVVGHDHGRGELRRFRADRIEGRVAVGAPESFERPEGFDPGAALADQPFRIGEGEVERVRVLVDGLLADKVVGELGADAVEERRDDGAVVVALDVTNQAGLRSWVLGLRDHAEVLGPPAVREALCEYLRAIAL
jgi:predicted DNA-binding transcriptional regulator YafY